MEHRAARVHPARDPHIRHRLPQRVPQSPLPEQQQLLGVVRGPQVRQVLPDAREPGPERQPAVQLCGRVRGSEHGRVLSQRGDSHPEQGK